MHDLISCANVKFYDFETDVPTISDLDNYIDACHPAKSVNDYVIRSLENDSCLVAPFNLESYVQAFEDAVHQPFAHEKHL